MTEEKQEGTTDADQQDQSVDATTTDVATTPAKESSEDASEKAWKEFPTQVEAALEYARTNTYDYGPSLRDAKIEHKVVSAEAMSERITRVVLEYWPTEKFKGQSGSEFLDVDDTGAIQVRRQLRTPKESMPWVLVGAAALSVVAALVLVPLIFLANDSPDPTFVAGRTIFVKSEQPRVVSYVTYQGNDSTDTPRTWIIVPEGQETAIAYVELQIFNETSGVVTLAIDGDAAELTTEDGITVQPVDMTNRALWPAEDAVLDPRLEVFELPLWGDKSLESGFSIRGFMAFEVPKGSEIASLRWAATDVANIRY